MQNPALTVVPKEEPGYDPDEALFLLALGRQVRQERERRGMARRIFAREAQLSERYVAQLEAGKGNISIILLRRVAKALGVSLNHLIEPPTIKPPSQLLAKLLDSMPTIAAEALISRLLTQISGTAESRRRRIALIGLRGAGKSTLGTLLAKARNVPFVELRKEVERIAGTSTEEIFSLYGQAGYRRLERKALDSIIVNHLDAVISVGGGFVADDEAFDVLLRQCFTVWVKASPEEHMARVVAQGDFRPMADSDEAMTDLRRILEAREPLYRRADVQIDTSAEEPAQSLAKLQNALQL